MGVNTLVKDGIVNDLGLKVDIVPVEGLKGEVHYNPGLTRDDKGNTWVSIRSCTRNIEPFKGFIHPMKYENYLHIGKLNEETLEITGIKEVLPKTKHEGLHWGIEDIRLFWREDGLHGIGVILPITESGPKANEAEILIDYEAGTYEILTDFGRPMGTPEKNWMPAEHKTQMFDFTYSPTQIVFDGNVLGEPNDLYLHNGTPLIKYGDGYLSIMHMVCSVQGERTYVSVAAMWSEEGRVTHLSQPFHFNVGWREELKETIEFASAILWTKPEEEVLVGLGVKDEYLGFCRIPVEKFEWEPYRDTLYYNWQWATPPNREEVVY